MAETDSTDVLTRSSEVALLVTCQSLFQSHPEPSCLLLRLFPVIAGTFESLAPQCSWALTVRSQPSVLASTAVLVVVSGVAVASVAVVDSAVVVDSVAVDSFNLRVIYTRNFTVSQSAIRPIT
jgi:hypothetical protein